ncbi:MAG TPA: fibronectin type III domain-containing protein [Solirubrobacteraceae bacterium]|nr:fibronectin type III domain-containing protein [Solirubrobacteraceae bacterium]
MSKRAHLGTLGALALAALAIATGAFAAGGPTVSAVTTSAVTNDSATLAATVNPNGQATTYAFEYGTSTHYTQQTAAQSAGSGTQPVPGSILLTGLRPGTTYHVRLLASNVAGTAASNDATFTTTGIAPPGTGSAQVTTGAASAITVDGAKLSGTVNPTGISGGETVHYYFQLGAGQPYALQTLEQSFKATGAPVPVSAQVSNIESMHLFHYRLVAVSEAGQVSVGADQTFTTLPKERLVPSTVQATASPSSQRRLPDRVTVSGKMVPPASMSAFLACRGYFDITFRVGQVAVQSLRAGIHKDCTFSLPVVFHNRRRLMGGRVTVHVLFAGNRFLHRLEAPLTTIQVG